MHVRSVFRCAAWRVARFGWCSVFVLCVDPVVRVTDQRRVDVAGLLVLRKPRLAFDRDAEVVERGIQLEFHLRVVVEAGLPALPVGVHHLDRSEEHTSELQSLMRISYAVFCLKKKNNNTKQAATQTTTNIDNS